MKKELTVKHEFLMLTVPATELEQEHLMKSLLREGCKEPLITWNGIIIDGFKRYQICQYEEIDFDVIEKDFLSFEEAVSWVCRKRIQEISRNSTIRRYLIGSLYQSEKAIFKRSWKFDPDREIPVVIYNRPLGPVRTFVSIPLGKELGLNFETVERLGTYAAALNRIDELEPALFQGIITGEMKFSRMNVIKMSKMDKRKLSEIRRRYQHTEEGFLRTQMLSRDYEGNPRTAISEPPLEVPLTVGIKTMPAFDPDMEIKGLALTIPTWMTAIARAEKKTDMSLASESAKKLLTANLLHLEEQIHQTLEAIECRKKEF